MSRSRQRPNAETRLRKGRAADIEALLALERRAFATDRISSRAFRRFVTAPSAAFIVATLGGAPAGYAVVLFRSGSKLARLYSLLVDADAGGRGIGTRLLAAAERAARKRGAAVLRLEVRTRNRRAIGLYEAAGYRVFGRHEDYYEDGAPALRYAKTLRRGA
jgi:ribosomal protein S18 acetylase RimI-like enzyme